MFGISYLGYVQWAALGGLNEMRSRQAQDKIDQDVAELNALIPAFSASDMYTTFFPGSAISLDTMLRWLHEVHFMGGHLFIYLFIYSHCSFETVKILKEFLLPTLLKNFDQHSLVFEILYYNL